MFNLYLYGGTVRDQILGIQSNDLDYVAVCEVGLYADAAFSELCKQVSTDGLDIFHTTDGGRYTIRGVYPKNHATQPGVYKDITLSAKDGLTIDLETFLRGCDFTINAIAMDDSGAYIDPLNGIRHLELSFLRACSPTTFNDDPIRIIRMFRFAKKYKLQFSPVLDMLTFPLNKFSELSTNRIKDEMIKCFEDPIVGCSIVTTLHQQFPDICEYIFSKVKLRASIIK